MGGGARRERRYGPRSRGAEGGAGGAALLHHPRDRAAALAGAGEAGRGRAGRPARAAPAGGRGHAASRRDRGGPGAGAADRGGDGDSGALHRSRGRERRILPRGFAGRGRHRPAFARGWRVDRASGCAAGCLDGRTRLRLAPPRRRGRDRDRAPRDGGVPHQCARGHAALPGRRDDRRRGGRRRRRRRGRAPRCW